ncbi:HAD-IA family hydrolase [Fructilactobacillus sp. Tb1]|uniref:HAD-IA family hydrolase n=1 Tax=Fructilactobacillus sp. Tb1 TaxID=3422304 RepID=UPI003D2DB734
MIKNLIWDFDGTLFDTYPFMVTAFVKALQELGIDDVDIDPDAIYEQMRIYSLGSAIAKYSARFGIDKDKLLQIYKSFERDEVELVKPFDGVKAALQKIIADGGQNALLTHRNDQALALLDRYDLKKYFTGFVTSDNHFKRKPDPESLNYLIHTLTLVRTETAMIGDRELDVRAGDNAVVTTILFDPDYLIEINNVDFIIRNYHGLLPIIQ